MWSLTSGVEGRVKDGGVVVLILHSQPQSGRVPQHTGGGGVTQSPSTGRCVEHTQRDHIEIPALKIQRSSKRYPANAIVISGHSEGVICRKEVLATFQCEGGGGGT